MAVKKAKSARGGRKTTKSPASKKGSSSSKSGSTKTTGNVRFDVDKDSSVQVREIENGFLVAENGYRGKGRNKTWYTKEYFSATNPVKISMPKKPTMRFGSKK